jgi:enoyl-CoA hydratase
MGGQIRTEKRGAIGWILFDHPERRNAISVEMWAQLPEAAAALDADPDVRVVVLRGAGDVAFVAGADISQFGERRSDAATAHNYDRQNAAGFLSIARVAKPTIAMIQGFCFGGGVAIALSTDLRYASDDALFAIPAARLGLGYGMAGLETLANTVGFANAKEIMFTARRHTAEEALRIGLVNAVVPKAELEALVVERAEQIASNAPLTVRACKMAVNELPKEPSARDVDSVNAAVRACFDSDDYKEGVAAFLEKRRPRFQGR